MIQSTSQSNPLPPGGVSAPGAKSAEKKDIISSARDTLDTSSTNSVREALASLPEVRPEVVKQGEKLLADANYPPRAIIEDIAKLFIQSRDLTNNQN